MKKIVIASNNAGKLREIQQIMKPLNIEVVSQSSFNVPEAKEPHATFIENALAKARHASKMTTLSALADDSGICVEALNGEPGVHSARFAGEPKSDERNNQKLIAAMRQHINRKAHYYCVLVLVRYAEDPQPLIAEAEWRGEIIDVPRGTGGFGYDPLFFLPQLGKTAAELGAEHKNQISHRGKALQHLLHKLQKLKSEG